jgi:MoxR-like ATPase
MDNRLADFAGHVKRLRDEIAKVLVGQRSVVDGVVIALVADGHVLLEGVPGLGKTLLVKTLADAMSLEYRRIQFTPDLMPADIVGTHLLTEDASGRREMSFREGPVFTQLLLADEINRATPKTQSALLEAMAERQITIGGHRRPLPKPFLVLATQNPLEMEGTYPLPEAQLDRFFFKVLVPFPALDDLVEIMSRTTGNTSPSARAVLTADQLADLRSIVREVPIAPEVLRYAMRLVLATHADNALAAPIAKASLRYGASPRAAQTLVLGARAHALLAGRSHVAIEDIRAVAPSALRHRLGLTFEADAEGTTADRVVQKLLDEVPEVDKRVAAELAR